MYAERKKNLRKAPPGQGNLVPFPETKPAELCDNYYPYWYYYKVKNPDWIMRHRQTSEGQLLPYDYVNPSQYVHKPALTTTSTKSHRRHRKSHHRDQASIMQYNSDKQHYETVLKPNLSTK